LSELGTPRHRRDGVCGARERTRGPRGHGRGRSGDAGVPRIAGGLTATFVLVASLVLSACEGKKPEVRTTPSRPRTEEINFQVIESPSLQFLPRQEEATPWRLQEDPLVIPADRLGNYLDQDAVRFLHYGVLDLAAGKYEAVKGGGFATVEIFRFPDFVKAFGAYSIRKSPNIKYLSIQNEAFATAHAIHLWRGPFYVRITGRGEADSLVRLATFVADRMPAASGKPGVFTFFPDKGRVPNSERYAADSGFGQKYLGNSFQASFTVDNDPIDGLIIPTANKLVATQLLNDYRGLYAANGKLLDPIPNLGEDNFTAEDQYLGRTIAFRLDRFVIAFNGYKDRQHLIDLATTTDQRILGTIRKELNAADEGPPRDEGPAWAKRGR
jgi:hypothetical protein